MFHTLALLLFFTLTGQTMAASTLGGRLVLDDEGAFFVNGRKIQSEHPGASLVTGRQPPGDRKSTRLNSSHVSESRMPSSA